MTDDRAKRLTQLRQAYEGGVLDEDTYRAAVAALDVQTTARASGAVTQEESRAVTTDSRGSNVVITGQGIFGETTATTTALDRYLNHIISHNWYLQLQSLRSGRRAVRSELIRAYISPRAYPWGDNFDIIHCNSVGLRLGDTTPVGIFPTGASPYGVLDMAGNVGEWTRSLWGRDDGRVIKVAHLAAEHSTGNGKMLLQARDLHQNLVSGNHATLLPSVQPPSRRHGDEARWGAGPGFPACIARLHNCIAAQKSSPVAALLDLVAAREWRTMPSRRPDSIWARSSATPGYKDVAARHRGHPPAHPRSHSRHT